jgi:hypothetical protein
MAEAESKLDGKAGLSSMVLTVEYEEIQVMTIGLE